MWYEFIVFYDIIYVLPNTQSQSHGAQMPYFQDDLISLHSSGYVICNAVKSVRRDNAISLSPFQFLAKTSGERALIWHIF